MLSMAMIGSWIELTITSRLYYRCLRRLLRSDRYQTLTLKVRHSDVSDSTNFCP
jgi:hypothetical protein